MHQWNLLSSKFLISFFLWINHAQSKAVFHSLLWHLSGLADRDCNCVMVMPSYLTKLVTSQMWQKWISCVCLCVHGPHTKLLVLCSNTQKTSMRITVLQYYEGVEKAYTCDLYSLQYITSSKDIDCRKPIQLLLQVSDKWRHLFIRK